MLLDHTDRFLLQCVDYNMCSNDSYRLTPMVLHGYTIIVITEVKLRLS